MGDAKWAAVLLAHLDGVAVECVDEHGDGIRIRARTSADGGACPGCGFVSRRVHSRYERRIADGAVGGREVEIRLVVRRFRCGRALCGRATFVEQVDGLTFRHGRRTAALHAVLRMVGLMLAGRSGARLARELDAPVSRSTLLRLVRAVPEQAFAVPRVLGVDDFARSGSTESY